MIKSNELIVFLHNDLDAWGCQLNIEHKMPGIKKKYFYTNYANIPQQVNDIIAYSIKNNIKNIVIADVSFGDNKESLKILYDRFDKVFHIDHHLYADGFWDDFPNMKVVYDKTKCATKLCHEFFGNSGQSRNLDNLTEIIDVYDLWQTKSQYFEFAQELNEYFWTYDMELLTKKVQENNYALPEDFTSTVRNIKERYTKAIQEYEEKGQIQRAGFVTFCFFNDWFNQVLIKEMKNEQDFVIGINTRGIVRVRIRQESPYTLQQKNKLRMALVGTENVGHENVLTYKIQGIVNYDSIIEEAKRIDKHLQEIFL